MDNLFSSKIVHISVTFNWFMEPCRDAWVFVLQVLEVVEVCGMADIMLDHELLWSTTHHVFISVSIHLLIQNYEFES